MKRADAGGRETGGGGEGVGQPVVLQGTLDVMILSVLSQGEAHGYGIAREIERRSGGVLAIEEGSLYPALHRLTKRGDLSAAWRLSETGRRARFYCLTSGGRKQLEHQRSLWEKLSGAVRRVLGENGSGGVVSGWQGA